MKVLNLNYALCLLVLMTACQAKKNAAQTPEQIKAANAVQTGAKTSLPTDGKRDVMQLNIGSASTNYGRAFYEIKPQIENDQLVGYAINFRYMGSDKKEAQKPYAIMASEQPDLFKKIDSIFLGQVKITEVKQTVGHPIKTEDATAVVVISASAKLFDAQNPIFEGGNCEKIIADLDVFITQEDARTADQASRLGDRKYKSVSVDVNGGGSIAYSIQQSDRDENAYTIKVSKYRFKAVSASIEINADSGKVFQAVDALLYGKLDSKVDPKADANIADDAKDLKVAVAADASTAADASGSAKDDDQSAALGASGAASSSGTPTPTPSPSPAVVAGSPTPPPAQGDMPPMRGSWSSVKLIPLTGPIVEVKDASSGPIFKALGMIDTFIGLSLSDTNPETRTEPVTCQTLDLNGVWQSDLVSDQGQIVNLISTITRGSNNADGSQNFSGSDQANGSSAATSYKYTAQSCILQKTVNQQAKLFKIIFVGGASRQLVKIAPCQDQACTQVDVHPGYTEMAILKRLK